MSVRGPFVWTVALLGMVPAPAFAAPHAGQVTPSSLNVRATPNGSRLGVVLRGQKFVVSSEQGSWSRIHWGGRQAWVFSRHLSDTNADAIQVSAAHLNVRHGPATSYGVLTTVRAGQRYVKLAERGNWTRIQLDQRAGWVATWLVRDVALTSAAPPTSAPAPSSAPRMTATQTELEILARICKGEASVASYEGKVAVCAVVLNRVQSRRHPNTIRGVAHQPWQFSCYNPDVRDRLYWGPIPQSCWDAARDALNGWDPSRGATFYFNPYLVAPSWARTLRFLVRIGTNSTNTHDFYAP